MITPDTPILSSPSGTHDQCIQYILNHPHGEYNEEDVATIVSGYFVTCEQVGMDAVMVIAQMIHETGNLSSWWSQRPRRNPAGIGVTGRSTTAIEKPKGAWEQKGPVWLEGMAFKSWAQESIPAHVGRLLAYALHDGQGTAHQHHLAGYAMGIRPLPASFRGAASTWKGLQGRWAVPGAFYIRGIIAIADRIIAL